MYENIELIYEGSLEGLPESLDTYSDTIASLAKDITELKIGYNTTPGKLRETFVSPAKIYEIPFDKADSLIEELNVATGNEGSRVKVFSGITFKIPNESTVTGYETLIMSHARELGEYTTAQDLGDSKIAIYTEAVPIEDGRFKFGSLVATNYVTIEAKDQCVIAVMTPQAGLASNPEISDKILSEYASKIIEVREKE